MAGSPEQQDNRGFVETSSTGIRNSGVLVAILGTILSLANAPLGETIFWGGVALGLIGEVGRRAAGSGKQ